MESFIIALMIKLLCIANPQCTRMQSVMEALYNRNPPMPESYMEQIMDGGETVSQLEVLEANVSESMYQVEQIINQIKRVYETDTTNSWASDSLTSLLTWHNNLFSRYELALKHLFNGDTELMEDLLESIPQEFEMDDSTLAAHQDYMDYLELLDLLREEERLPVDLTVEEIEELLTLVSNDRNYASAWARTMLKLSCTDYLYQEPIITETVFNPRKGRTSTSIRLSKPTIRAYPNPSKYFVNLDLLEITVQEDDFLIVTDLKGNEVHRVDLTQRQEGYVMNVQPLKTGIYVVTLWQRGSPVATTKINKQ